MRPHPAWAVRTWSWGTDPFGLSPPGPVSCDWALKRSLGVAEDFDVKGIVFNLLEEVVSAEHGDQTWDALVDAAGVSGVYTSLGSYPDEELVALVAAASEALAVPADEVIRWFGRQMMPRFAARYAALFAAHTSLRSFVLSLNDMIHPEVRKLYPGAITPHFVVTVASPQTLLMEYQSQRRLCALAEGLLQGAADHYGDRITIERPRCLKQGDDRCILAVTSL